MMEMANPWNIQSIYDLQYFNCPSCIFKTHSKQKIVNHAYEFHSDSVNFLSNLKDNSLEDVICPWKCEHVTEIKTDDCEIVPKENFENKIHMKEFSIRLNPLTQTTIDSHLRVSVDKRLQKRGKMIFLLI